MKFINKKNKKLFISTALGVFFALIFFLLTDIGQISAQYTTQEAIPGQGTTDNFGEYLNMLYRFGIGIAALLAVFMIGYGAFMYIVTSAGSTSKIADAKGIITNAIIGLVLALVAWLILFVVNPDLVGGLTEMDLLEAGVPLPPDEVCEGWPDGSNGKGGACSREGDLESEGQFDAGADRTCWEGRCQTVCYDAAGQPLPNETVDPKCGTFNGQPAYRCFEGECISNSLPAPGEDCGPYDGWGDRIGLCQFPSEGDSCFGEGVKVFGPDKCTRGTICCEPDDNWWNL